MEQYNIRECIIIADRGLASYEMPKRKGIYFIVAIRRNFDVVDFNMKLDRSFMFNNRGINSSVKDLGGKYLYMYEDTSLRAEEETNMIRKIEIGEKEQNLSQKISVKDTLFELSKIYVIADGARRSVRDPCVIAG